MKKYFLLWIIALICVPHLLYAQQPTTTYWVTGWEVPFQWATIDNDGDETGNLMRFAPVFNLQGLFNVDPGSAVGFFTGLAVRNIGFIYNVPQQPVKKKFRTYNIAVPVGMKIGKMTGTFLYAGYEIEFPFNYKEKTFENEIKSERFVVWFSDRVPAFYNTVFVGINLRKGFNVKFKYYFTNFHNKNFTEVVDGVESQPYKNLNSNVLYVSLNINLFRNVRLYYSKNDFKK